MSKKDKTLLILMILFTGLTVFTYINARRTSFVKQIAIKNNKSLTSIDIKGIFDSGGVLQNDTSKKEEIKQKDKKENSGNISNNINESKIPENITKNVEKVNTELNKIKDESVNSFESLKKQYGGIAVFAIIANALNLIANITLAFGILGYIAILIYEKVFKLENKEMYKIKTSILIAILITQILPLIFAIILKGWTK